MSETRIDINDLPKRFPELLENAGSGNEIVVTQGDVPRAKLVVIQQPRPRIAGLHPGAIEVSDDFDDFQPDFAASENWIDHDAMQWAKREGDPTIALDEVRQRLSKMSGGFSDLVNLERGEY